MVRTSPRARRRKSPKPIPRGRIAEALAKVQQLKQMRSRDLMRVSKRKRRIRNDRSYLGWLRNPSVGDLIDSENPARLFDTDVRSAKQKARAARRRASPGYQRELERRHVKKARKVSPQVKARLRKKPTPRRVGVLAKRKALRKLPFPQRILALLAPEKRSGLQASLIGKRQEELKAMQALCNRADCARFRKKELATYVDFSKWRAAFHKDGQLVGLLLGSPHWDIKPEGDWVAKSEDGRVVELDAATRDKTAYLVLVCAAEGQGYGAALVKAFIAAAKQSGARHLAMDVGGGCKPQLVSFYKRLLPDLEAVDVERRGKARRGKRFVRHYRGVWGTIKASMYMTPI